MTDDKIFCANWLFSKQKQWGINLLKGIEAQIKRESKDMTIPPAEVFKTATNPIEDAQGPKLDTSGGLKERAATDSFALVEEITEEQWALYTMTLKVGRSTSNHVRVNFVGNQSAGKTTLVKRLQGILIKCPDPEQKPIEALDIDQSTSRCIEIDGKRDWETASEGFLEELIHQRMAEAMKTVETKINKQLDTDVGDESEYSKSDDDIKKSFEDLLTQPDKGVSRSDEETLSLKKILRKKSSGIERRYISYWDFGGQSVYYSAHQLFMSPSAVYVLVFDLSKDWEEKDPSKLTFRSHVLSECSNEECLKYWISSIRSFTHDAKGGCAPVLLVGTHLDKLKDKVRMAEKNKSSGNVLESKIKHIVGKKIKELREILQLPAVQCVTIDNRNADREELDVLRNKILDLGLGLSNEDVPVAWIELERLMRLKQKSGKQRLSFADLRKLNSNLDFPMRQHSRLEAFLGYQHQRGQLLHYQHNDLRDLIILDPRIIAKFLNNLMRSEDSADQQSVMPRTDDYNHNGIINDMYVERCAKVMKENYDLQIKVDILLSLLKQLYIIHEFRSAEDRPKYLLPCLLPPHKKGRGYESNSHMHKFKIAFPENHLPPTFYHIFIAGLLNEGPLWTLLETEVGRQEIYNLYACFRVRSDAQQIHVYWKQSCIYVEVVNFSIRNKIRPEDIEDIISSIKTCISKIFTAYRQHNALYDLYIQCPKCPKSEDGFVSLLKLREDGEALCLGKREKYRHCIGVDEVLRKEPTKDLKSKPTEVELGRLARYLKDDAVPLAIRIKLYLANLAADTVIAKTPNVNLQRFQLLMRWKSSSSSATLRDLFELLTVTKDYQMTDLYSAVQTEKMRNNHELPDEQLDIAPFDNKDIIAASSCIGADYPFLFLELGLRHVEIEVADHNHRELSDRVLHLLERWRQNYPDKSTTRQLLDTINFIGTDTTEIVKRIKERINDK